MIISLMMRNFAASLRDCLYREEEGRWPGLKLARQLKRISTLEKYLCPKYWILQG